MTEQEKRKVRDLQNQLREVRSVARHHIFEWGEVMAMTAGKRCAVHSDDDGMVTRLKFYDRDGSPFERSEKKDWPPVTRAAPPPQGPSDPSTGR